MEIRQISVFNTESATVSKAASLSTDVTCRERTACPSREVNPGQSTLPVTDLNRCATIENHGCIYSVYDLS